MIKKYGYKMYPIQQKLEVFSLHNPSVNIRNVCMDICLYVRIMYIHVYVPTYVYTSMYIHMYVYVYTYVCMITI